MESNDAKTDASSSGVTNLQNQSRADNEGTEDGKTSNNQFQTDCLKVIVPRVITKLTRFLFLGQIYASWAVFDCMSGINLHGFPSIYLWCWLGLSLLLGFVLLLFGRPTLLQDEVREILQTYRFSRLDLLCDGKVYKYLNIVLCFIFPGLVISYLQCYTDFVRINHARFAAAYYALLVALKLLDKCRFCLPLHTLAVIVSLGICTLTGNLAGVVGSLFMLYTGIIADDYGEQISTKWYPFGQALGSFGSLLAITWSFRHMSGTVDEEFQIVPMIYRDDICENFNILCQ